MASALIGKLTSKVKGHNVNNSDCSVLQCMNFSLFNILVVYLTLCVRFSVFFVLVSLT